MRLFHVDWRTLDSDPPDDAGRWTFEVADAVPPGGEEAAIREAIGRYYAAVLAGAEERVRGYHPNWGDAVDDLPAEAWAASGLRLLADPSPYCRTIVVRGEILFRFDRADGRASFRGCVPGAGEVPFRIVEASE